MPIDLQYRFAADCTERRRLKVLVSAYACVPNHGSEPEVGWAFSTTMATHHDVWVLTRAGNRERIEAELAQRPVPGLNFIYYDPPDWFEWGQHGGLRMQLHSYCWQLLVIPKLRAAHREIGFDLAHHVTFAKYWAPSCLAWLDIPFIWGPVGGAEQTPSGLLCALNRRGKLAEGLKILVSRLEEHDPFVRRTARRADLAFASTPETVERLKKTGAQSVRVMTQIGVTASTLQPSEPESSVCRFISIGRLIHWKGFLLGLKAFQKSGLENAVYWVVGDGPCRAEMEQFAVQHQLKVIFYGTLPFSETQQRLQTADVLVHPAFHDSAGFVCLEAMSCGKPVICLDTGGPAVIVENSCGIKIDRGDVDSTIEEFSEAMIRLAKNPTLRQTMGENGLRHVCCAFTWEVKSKSVSNCYLEVLHQKKLIRKDAVSEKRESL